MDINFFTKIIIKYTRISQVKLSDPGRYWYKLNTDLMLGTTENYLVLINDHVFIVHGF